MNQMRILFLGGGKRVSLCERFSLAAKNEGLELVSYAYEASTDQPISKYARVIVGKSWSDITALNDVRKLATELEIDLIVSNVDPATLIHAKLAPELTAASISSTESTTAVCLSKIEFQKFCESANLNIIPRAKEFDYPYFAKPDLGSASVGTRLISDQHDLAKLENKSKFLIQKYISGTEFTVDAYVSRAGIICGVSPRIRVATSGGESTITEVISDSEIIIFAREVIQSLNLIGPITIQFIREEKTGDLYLMEVNPRFAGGVIASIEAGFDFPRMMIQDILGQKPMQLDFGKKLIMKRYFMEAFYAVDN